MRKVGNVWLHEEGDALSQGRAEPSQHHGATAFPRDETDSDIQNGLPEDEWIAKLLDGKYRIERRLGSGGMGSVYEARHIGLERRVAVKVLHAEYASQPAVLKRFENEAKAVGRLQHPNLVAVTDFGWLEGRTPYIVMEYLPGRDCSGLIAATGPLPGARAADIAFQACLGLSIAHGAGVVHRDIKPENLFVTDAGDGRDLVKVLDFGIAKLRTASTTAGTAAGSTIGTYYYMSPEQVRDSANVDARTDVWSMGVVLYELLSGEKPFLGEEVIEVVYKIVHSAPASLRAVRPDLPSALIDVVERAMKKDPAERTPSVEHLGQELAGFAGRPSFSPQAAISAVDAARSPMAFEPTAPAPTTSQAGVSLSSSIPPKRTRHARGARLAVVAAVALVLATSLVIYFVAVLSGPSPLAARGPMPDASLDAPPLQPIDGVTSSGGKRVVASEEKGPPERAKSSTEQDRPPTEQGRPPTEQGRPSTEIGRASTEQSRPSTEIGRASTSPTAEVARRQRELAKVPRAPREPDQAEPPSSTVPGTASAASSPSPSPFDTLY